MDVAIGAGVGVLGMAELASGDAATLSTFAAVLLGLPVMFRLASPAIAVAVTVVLIGGLTFANHQETPLAAAVALVITVGTAATTMPTVRSAPLLGALLGVIAVLIAIQGTPLDVAFAAFLYGGAWIIGLELRRRHEQSQATKAEAAHAIERIVAENSATIAQERLRIARELHDVVGHSLSVVTLHTQAVRRRMAAAKAGDRTGQVDRDQDALRAAEAAARTAMAELRRLFGLLRSDERPSLEPQPRLAQISELADALSTAGLRATIHIDDDLDLPAGVDLAAFRIVQEAVTNILRHSGARSAAISLTRDFAGLRILVTDDGIGAAPVVAGHGLIGMRERVDLYRGTLKIESPETGGCCIEALLPLDDLA